MSEGKRHNTFVRSAGLIAHQLQAPLSAVSSYLRTLLGGYAGAMTPKQRGLVERANTRCDEAIAAVQRMLYVVQALDSPSATESICNFGQLLHRVHASFLQRAAEEGIRFEVVNEGGDVVVKGDAHALTEAVAALVSNALKYTPENGRVRLNLARTPGNFVRLKVGDSGIGIPPEERERIFEPFFRSTTAKGSARAGVGLGLAFAKAVFETAGGSITVGASDLGGAEFSVMLVEAESTAAKAREEGKAGQPLKVVIVGGVAAGPKVASKIIRSRPDTEVTVIERGRFLSYAGCGLPYYVSGMVHSQRELMSTAAGAVRDPIFFQKVKNVHVHNETEAIEIDRENKRILVRNFLTSEDAWLDYDKLVLATGATPVKPPLPGIDLPNVFTLHGVHDAEGIRSMLSEGKARDVVIVGGGLIGVEATEALVESGCRVSVVEMMPQVLGMLDWEMAKLVEKHMEANGVRVLTDTRVTAIEGEEWSTRVTTATGKLSADMVIMAVGVQPSVGLARAAGLEIGETGAIKVDEYMCTSDPDIYAAGDCVECRDMLTGRAIYMPLGSTANKQGRVAAVNICGGREEFRGILGSTICKVFEYCVGRTGLTESSARALGYDAVAVLAPAPDKAHFMPDAQPLMLKLVVDAATRKVLGAQVTGPGDGAKRVDVAAMAITAGMTVDQLANADLCYAPPYSPAMDNIITAANVARNKLDGCMTGIAPIEVHRLTATGGTEATLLDVRTQQEFEEVRLPSSINIPLGLLRRRLHELDKSKTIVTFCKVSLGGYEAALILKAAGFHDVRVMDGGIDMWPYEKLT